MPQGERRTFQQRDLTEDERAVLLDLLRYSGHRCRRRAIWYLVREYGPGAGETVRRLFRSGYVSLGSYRRYVHLDDEQVRMASLVLGEEPPANRGNLFGRELSAEEKKLLRNLLRLPHRQGQRAYNILHALREDQIIRADIIQIERMLGRLAAKGWISRSDHDIARYFLSARQRDRLLRAFYKGWLGYDITTSNDVPTNTMSIEPLKIGDGVRVTADLVDEALTPVNYKPGERQPGRYGKIQQLMGYHQNVAFWLVNHGSGKKIIYSDRELTYVPPEPPPAPTNLSVTVDGDYHPHISWHGEPGCTFRVIRIIGVVWQTIWTGTQMACTDTSTSRGLTYIYKVAAVRNKRETISEDERTISIPPVQQPVTNLSPASAPPRIASSQPPRKRIRTVDV
jgi:hypothetical protein